MKHEFSRQIFRKILKHRISSKSAWWEPKCSMRTDRQPWRTSQSLKDWSSQSLFRNYANATENWILGNVYLCASWIAAWTALTGMSLKCNLRFLWGTTPFLRVRCTTSVRQDENSSVPGKDTKTQTLRQTSWLLASFWTPFLRSTAPKVHKSRAKKFFMVPPNTGGPSVWKFVITCLAPKVLSWLLLTCAVCASLSHTRAPVHTHSHTLSHTHTHTHTHSHIPHTHSHSHTHKHSHTKHTPHHSSLHAMHSTVLISFIRSNRAVLIHNSSLFLGTIFYFSRGLDFKVVFSPCKCIPLPPPAPFST
jgi:hypothetical protein